MFIIIELFTGEPMICVDDDGYAMRFASSQEAAEYAYDNLQKPFTVVEV